MMSSPHSENLEDFEEDDDIIFENSATLESVLTSDDDEIASNDVTPKKMSKENLKTSSTSLNIDKTIDEINEGISKNDRKSESSCSTSSFFDQPKEIKSEAILPIVKKMESLMIRGVTIELPVKPYRSQVALMSSVLQSIQKNQNSLLESPTGTGKTLALLCASLAWQNQELENRKVASVTPLWPNQETTDESTDSQTHTCMENSTQENMENLSKKPKLNVDVSTPKKSTLKISSPSCSPQKSPSKYSPIPKIYFCSRTHSQLQQAVKELKKTKYCKDITMTTLSSRKQTCLQSLNHNYSSKDEMCQKTVNKSKIVNGTPKSGCDFFDNITKMMNKCHTPLLNEAWDIEDLLKMGKEHNSCPFYTSRKLAKFAKVIFCPYNYIINPSIRSSLEMGTDDIIIIDEAHNVEDCCRESVSLNFTFQNIMDAKNDIEQIYSINRQRHHVNLSNFLNKWFDWFRNHSNIADGDKEGTSVMNGGEFYQSLERHELGPQHTENLSKNINSVSENIKTLLKDHTNAFRKEITEKTLALLKSICVIFDIFYPNYNDYSVVVVRKPKLDRQSSSRDGWLSKTPHKPAASFELYLSINCLNPALAFKPVAENARCIILASGTLAPISSFSSELGVDFPICLQLSHNISSDQLWMSSISYGPGDIHLESNFANTKKVEWQDSLGKLIIWVCQTVPRGILCFLPSYSLVKILFQRWNENGMMTSITSHKDIFSEVNNMEEHNIMMTDYCNSCNEEKGAILFAVYRGKVSEGMDFKDDQARAVITVGIPYPNIKDEVVKAKMKFNDVNQKSNGLTSGSDWLRIQAFRALNQALGRCIRHKDDWGAVIMVDSRFIKPFFFNSISKWAQQYMRFYENWKSFSTSDQNLVTFINNKF